MKIPRFAYIYLIIIIVFAGCSNRKTLEDYFVKKYTLDFSNIPDLKSSIKSLRSIRTRETIGLDDYLILEDRYKKMLYYFDKTTLQYAKSLKLVDLKGNQAQFVNVLDSSDNYLILTEVNDVYNLVKIENSMQKNYIYEAKEKFYPNTISNKELNFINDSQFIAFNWQKIAKYPYTQYNADYNSTPIFGYYTIKKSGELKYDSSIMITPLLTISNHKTYSRYFPKATMRKKEELFLSYECSDSLYKINLQSNHLVRTKLKSAYPFSPIRIDSLTFFTNKPRFDSISKLQSEVTGLIYDKYRDVVYRILKVPIINNKVSTIIHKYILQVMKPNFDLIAELEVPENYDFEFINEEGYHFLIKSDLKKKKKTYAIYNFVP